MITTVDSNILFDIFRTDSPYHSQSFKQFQDAYSRGDIFVCDVVYAELAPFFDNRETLDSSLMELGAALSPINSSIAYEAGLRWKRYRDAGGPRSRIIADFLIGAHALASSDVLLTRDRGFFGTYFPEVIRNP